ncbi:hypothetical protein BC830DRAFT_311683 [Chytriomyces sp. MP71]|nr:hypothetical protein BC830DRAFT_311683 [Chytriomyces sp. MP71]
MQKTGGFSLLRHVPFFGWIAYLVGHIFFQRKIAVDQSRLAEALMHMPTSQESKTPLWLVIFPEGLLVHQRNLTKAKEFLDKLRRETPPPKFIVRQPSHVILPRSKGMWNVLQLLNPRHADSPIDTLVDVTMGFWPSSRGYESGLYPEHAHNPLGVFAHGGQEVLSAVHVDFRILNKGLVRTLTQLDENDFHVWLNKYWEGKDDLMGHFHRKGTFVGFKRDENIVRNSLPKEVRGDFMDTGYGGTSDSGFVVTDTGKAIFHVFPRFGDVLNLGILMAVPWTFVFGLIQLGKLVSNQL